MAAWLGALITGSIDVCHLTFKQQKIMTFISASARSWLVQVLAYNFQNVFRTEKNGRKINSRVMGWIQNHRRHWYHHLDWNSPFQTRVEELLYLKKWLEWPQKYWRSISWTEWLWNKCQVVYTEGCWCYWVCYRG